ncbi:MAG TPA: hypothetical protein VGT05_00080 [Patescibacteria group bacterium]|nr:hypothetical protein [Patescibacteria group bacterium]
MTKQKLVLFCLLFIFIIGCYLRLTGALSNSFAFTYDVGRDMLTLSQIISQHKLLLIGPTTGLPGVFYGPWWYYFLLPAFFLSSGNPQGVALFLGLVGCVTILAGYFLGKKIGGTLFGVIFGIFLSISPVLIAWSSQIWNPNIAPIFVLAVFYTLQTIRSSKNKSFIPFFILGLLLSLILDIEIVFGLLFCIGTVLAVVVLLKRFLSFKSICSFILGFLLILSPRIFFDARHQFLMTKSLFTLFTKGAGSETFNLIHQAQQSWNMLFSLWNYTFANNLLAGILVLIFSLTSFFFVRKHLAKTSQFFLVYCNIVISVFFIGLSFFKHDLFTHYVVGLPVVYIFIVTILCYEILKETTGKIYITALIAIIACVAISPIQLAASFSRPLWIGDASVYRNQLQVVTYIYKEAHGRQFKINVYTPPVFDYSYQYLFHWYGQKTYHYQPLQQTHLAFFILEPDLQYPFRLQNWLTVRKHDGLIIKTKQFPSGIIVQTRI